MAMPGRRDLLDAQDDATKAIDATGACPCCDAPLVRVDARAPLPCGQCGYPENSAAWVRYDGCC